MLILYLFLLLLDDRYIEPALGYLAVKKVGKGGQLLGKVDDTITGGKVTDWTENISDPILKKRDDFVEWACSKDGITSFRIINHAYADSGAPISKYNDCLMQQILGYSDDKMRHDRISHEGYYSRKELRKKLNEAEPADYSKHIKANTSEDAKMLSKKAAQYLPDVDNVKLEKQAMLNAEYVYKKGGTTYFFTDMGQIVGYDQGNATSLIRVEMTDAPVPKFHGHPISKKRFDKEYKGKATKVEKEQDK